MKMIPIYGPDQVLPAERKSPLDLVSEDIAQELVEKGLANWFQRSGSFIQLRKTQKKWDRNGLSCKPRQFVVEAAAAGKDWAVAIVEAWKWRPLCGVIEEIL